MFLSSSEGVFGLVEGAVAEYREEDVAASSSPDRLVTGARPA